MRYKVNIREGSTGILYITKDDGTEELYIPDSDLKESNRLLQEFYKLQSDDGKSIKDSFWKGGINWFPTTIALLHWHILYMYVKYKAFFEKFPMDKCDYIFANKGRLADFVCLISSYDDNRQEVSFYRLSFWKNRLQCWVSALHNKRVFRRYPQILLLFMRYGPDDFRTKDVKATLDDLGIKYIEYGWPSFYQMLRILLGKNASPRLLPSWKITCNTRVPVTIPEESDPMLKRVLQTAVFAIQDRIYRFQETFEFLKKI